MNKISYASLRPVLESMADEKYRAFHARLVPGIHDFLGIRIPRLRKLGRDLSKAFSGEADWRAFLDQVPVLYEEVMLRGIVIGLMPVRMIREGAEAAQEAAETVYFQIITSHVKYIDNWALCDYFCSGLKQKALLNDVFFDTLRRQFLCSSAAGCWTIRVGLVLLLSHFTDRAHITPILDACRTVAGRIPEFRYEDTFYIRMGMAWLLAECYIKCRPETRDFLFGGASLENMPEDWTFHKTIRKIIESNRIESDEKALLRTYVR